MLRDANYTRSTGWSSSSVGLKGRSGNKKIQYSTKINLEENNRTSPRTTHASQKKKHKKKYNNENLKKYKKKQQKIVQSEVCI